MQMSELLARPSRLQKDVPFENPDLQGRRAIDAKNTNVTSFNWMNCNFNIRSTSGGLPRKAGVDKPPRRNREKAREEMAPQQPRREDLTTRLMPKTQRCAPAPGWVSVSMM